MTDGRAVELFTLTNAGGSTAKITTYGARLTEVHVPDRNGKRADVVLGFDNLAQYVSHREYFGTTTGRVANRIAGGKFEIDGIRYTLPLNNGPNTLHGGTVGVDRAVWAGREVTDPAGPTVEFSHVSPDEDQGFPGDLSMRVRYTFTDANEVCIEFHATTDKPTPVNLCNHSYFNLAGAGSGPIYDHVLMLNASHYTPVNEALIPTGEILPVAGTIMDFRRPTPIGAHIREVPGGGYDHNYVLDSRDGHLALAARVEDPRTGRKLEVFTTEPGIQFYSGNFLDGSLQGIGGRYERHGGFCLETQHFPDAVHHANFPSIILRPGETYRHTVVYAFGVS